MKINEHAASAAATSAAGLTGVVTSGAGPTPGALTSKAGPSEAATSGTEGSGPSGSGHPNEAAAKAKPTGEVHIQSTVPNLKNLKRGGNTHYMLWSTIPPTSSKCAGLEKMDI